MGEMLVESLFTSIVAIIIPSKDIEMNTVKKIGCDLHTYLCAGTSLM
jgi:hypothetical protein